MSKTKQNCHSSYGVTIDHDNTLKLCGAGAPGMYPGSLGGDCSNLKYACPSDSACLQDAKGWHCGSSKLMCYTNNHGFGPGEPFNVNWNPNTKSLNYCDGSACVLPEPRGVTFCPDKNVCATPDEPPGPYSPVPHCMLPPRIGGQNCSLDDGTPMWQRL